MKILVYTDNHFCRSSSIVRGRGLRYSNRLENQIRTLNWLEQLATDENCTAIINAGDFFDHPDLTSEEISALTEIKWNPSTWHYFLVGNHDASNESLTFSSANLFSLCANSVVVNKVTLTGDDSFAVLFVPYITQISKDADLSLKELLKDQRSPYPKKVLMISHNEIKGLQYGKYTSTAGLSIEDIEAHCDLCINGHLHNQSWVTSKILNLGNITGQNFSEDAQCYKHCCAIVDTTTMQCKLIENPHALNFYKIDLATQPDFDWERLNQNSVVTIKCSTDQIERVRAILSERNVLSSRFIAASVVADKQQVDDVLSIDHYKRFQDFVLSKIGDDALIREELNLVCSDQNIVLSDKQG